MEILDDLTGEQAGKVFKAIKAFEMDGELPEFTGELKMAWIPFKNALIRTRKKWEEKCEKARKAALKRWAKQNGRILPPDGKPTDEYFDMQTDANAYDGIRNVETNANNADSDSVSDSDSEPVPLSEKN